MSTPDNLAGLRELAAGPLTIPDGRTIELSPDGRIILPEQVTRAACKAGGVHLSLTFGPTVPAPQLDAEQREALDMLQQQAAWQDDALKTARQENEQLQRALGSVRERLAVIERDREACPGRGPGETCSLTRGEAARGACYIDGCPFRPQPDSAG